MTPTRPTRAELAERNAELLGQLAATQVDLQQAKAQVPSRPSRVTEADALAACIRALDILARESRDMGSARFAKGDEIERVLRYLANRYGVQLVEVRTEPCERAHVDEVDAYALQNAVHQAVAMRPDTASGNYPTPFVPGIHRGGR